MKTAWQKWLQSFTHSVLLFLCGKGGADMMAMFFAQRVILGKTEFKDVPAKLKEQVREILIDSGLPELVAE